VNGLLALLTRCSLLPELEKSFPSGLMACGQDRVAGPITLCGLVGRRRDACIGNSLSSPSFWNGRIVYSYSTGGKAVLTRSSTRCCGMGTRALLCSQEGVLGLPLAPLPIRPRSAYTVSGASEPFVRLGLIGFGLYLGW